MATVFPTKEQIIDFITNAFHTYYKIDISAYDKSAPEVQKDTINKHLGDINLKIPLNDIKNIFTDKEKETQLNDKYTNLVFTAIDNDSDVFEYQYYKGFFYIKLKYYTDLKLHILPKYMYSMNKVLLDTDNKIIDGMRHVFKEGDEEIEVGVKEINSAGIALMEFTNTKDVGKYTLRATLVEDNNITATQDYVIQEEPCGKIDFYIYPETTMSSPCVVGDAVWLYAKVPKDYPNSHVIFVDENGTRIAEVDVIKYEQYEYRALYKYYPTEIGYHKLRAILKEEESIQGTAELYVDNAYGQDSLFVDQINGLDSNSGKSPQKPLKTIDEALARLTNHATIFLMSNYTIDDEIELIDYNIMLKSYESTVNITTTYGNKYFTLKKGRHLTFRDVIVNNNVIDSLEFSSENCDISIVNSQFADAPISQKTSSSTLNDIDTYTAKTIGRNDIILTIDPNPCQKDKIITFAAELSPERYGQHIRFSVIGLPVEPKGYHDEEHPISFIYDEEYTPDTDDFTQFLIPMLEDVSTLEGVQVDIDYKRVDPYNPNKSALTYGQKQYLGMVDNTGIDKDQNTLMEALEDKKYNDPSTRKSNTTILVDNFKRNREIWYDELHYFEEDSESYLVPELKRENKPFDIAHYKKDDIIILPKEEWKKGVGHHHGDKEDDDTFNYEIGLKYINDDLYVEEIEREHEESYIQDVIPGHPEETEGCSVASLTQYHYNEWIDIPFDPSPKTWYIDFYNGKDDSPKTHNGLSPEKAFKTFARTFEKVGKYDTICLLSDYPLGSGEYWEMGMAHVPFNRYLTITQLDHKSNIIFQTNKEYIGKYFLIPPGSQVTFTNGIQLGFKKLYNTVYDNTQGSQHDIIVTGDRTGSFWFVDQENGDDNNSGKFFDDAFKTLTKAMTINKELESYDVICLINHYYLHGKTQEHNGAELKKDTIVWFTQKDYSVLYTNKEEGVKSHRYFKIDKNSGIILRNALLGFTIFNTFVSYIPSTIEESYYLESNDLPSVETWYVDFKNGNNSNSGHKPTAPIKTLERAMESYNYKTIYLMNDCVTSSCIDVKAHTTIKSYLNQKYHIYRSGDSKKYFEIPRDIKLYVTGVYIGEILLDTYFNTEKEVISVVSSGGFSPDKIELKISSNPCKIYERVTLESKVSPVYVNRQIRFTDNDDNDIAIKYVDSNGIAKYDDYYLTEAGKYNIKATLIGSSLSTNEILEVVETPVDITFEATPNPCEVSKPIKLKAIVNKTYIHNHIRFMKDYSEIIATVEIDNNGVAEYYPKDDKDKFKINKGGNYKLTAEMVENHDINASVDIYIDASKQFLSAYPNPCFKPSTTNLIAAVGEDYKNAHVRFYDDGKEIITTTVDSDGITRYYGYSPTIEEGKKHQEHEITALVAEEPEKTSTIRLDVKQALTLSCSPNPSYPSSEVLLTAQVSPEHEGRYIRFLDQNGEHEIGRTKADSLGMAYMAGYKISLTGKYTISAELVEFEKTTNDSEVLDIQPKPKDVINLSVYPNPCGKLEKLTLEAELDPKYKDCHVTFIDHNDDEIQTVKINKHGIAEYYGYKIEEYGQYNIKCEVTEDPTIRDVEVVQVGETPDYITLLHTPFGNDIWYVDQSNGSDYNSGKTPESAFKTLEKAFDVYGDQDCISILSNVQIGNSPLRLKNREDLIIISTGECKISQRNGTFFYLPKDTKLYLDKLYLGDYYIDQTHFHNEREDTDDILICGNADIRSIWYVDQIHGNDEYPGNEPYLAWQSLQYAVNNELVYSGDCIYMLYDYIAEGPIIIPENKHLIIQRYPLSPSIISEPDNVYFIIPPKTSLTTQAITFSSDGDKRLRYDGIFSNQSVDCSIKVIAFGGKESTNIWYVDNLNITGKADDTNAGHNKEYPLKTFQKPFLYSSQDDYIELLSDYNMDIDYILPSHQLNFFAESDDISITKESNKRYFKITKDGAALFCNISLGGTKIGGLNPSTGEPYYTVFGSTSDCDTYINGKEMSPGFVFYTDKSIYSLNEDITFTIVSTPERVGDQYIIYNIHSDNEEYYTITIGPDGTGSYTTKVLNPGINKFVAKNQQTQEQKQIIFYVLDSGVWYIDQVNGDDSNGGNTPETALKTFTTALRKCDDLDMVNLIGDYVISEEIIVNKSIILEGYSDNPKLIPYDINKYFSLAPEKSIIIKDISIGQRAFNVHTQFDNQSNSNYYIVGEKGKESDIKVTLNIDKTYYLDEKVNVIVNVTGDISEYASEKIYLYCDDIEIDNHIIGETITFENKEICKTVGNHNLKAKLTIPSGVISDTKSYTVIKQKSWLSLVISKSPLNVGDKPDVNVTINGPYETYLNKTAYLYEDNKEVANVIVSGETFKFEGVDICDTPNKHTLRIILDDLELEHSINVVDNITLSIAKIEDQILNATPNVDITVAGNLSYLVGKSVELWYHNNKLSTTTISSSKTITFANQAICTELTKPSQGEIVTAKLQLPYMLKTIDSNTYNVLEPNSFEIIFPGESEETTTIPEWYLDDLPSIVIKLKGKDAVAFTKYCSAKIYGENIDTKKIKFTEGTQSLVYQDSKVCDAPGTFELKCVIVDQNDNIVLSEKIRKYIVKNEVKPVPPTGALSIIFEGETEDTGIERTFDQGSKPKIIFKLKADTGYNNYSVEYWIKNERKGVLTFPADKNYLEITDESLCEIAAQGLSIKGNLLYGPTYTKIADRTRRYNVNAVGTDAKLNLVLPPAHGTSERPIYYLKESPTMKLYVDGNDKEQYINKGYKIKLQIKKAGETKTFDYNQETLEITDKDYTTKMCDTIADNLLVRAIIVNKNNIEVLNTEEKYYNVIEDPSPVAPPTLNISFVGGETEYEVSETPSVKITTTGEHPEKYKGKTIDLYLDDSTTILTTLVTSSDGAVTSGALSICEVAGTHKLTAKTRDGEFTKISTSDISYTVKQHQDDISLQIGLKYNGTIHSDPHEHFVQDATYQPYVTIDGNDKAKYISKESIITLSKGSISATAKLNSSGQAIFKENELSLLSTPSTQETKVDASIVRLDGLGTTTTSLPYFVDEKQFTIQIQLDGLNTQQTLVKETDEYHTVVVSIAGAEDKPIFLSKIYNGSEVTLANGIIKNGSCTFTNIKNLTATSANNIILRAKIQTQYGDLQYNVIDKGSQSNLTIYVNETNGSDLYNGTDPNYPVKTLYDISNSKYAIKRAQAYHANIELQTDCIMKNDTVPHLEEVEKFQKSLIINGNGYKIDFSAKTTSQVEVFELIKGYQQIIHFSNVKIISEDIIDFSFDFADDALASKENAKCYVIQDSSANASSIDFYIDGTNGKDSYSGTEQTKPLRTFAKVIEKVNAAYDNENRQYIIGVIDTDEEWPEESNKIKCIEVI